MVASAEKPMLLSRLTKRCQKNCLLIWKRVNLPRPFGNNPNQLI